MPAQKVVIAFGLRLGNAAPLMEAMLFFLSAELCDVFKKATEYFNDSNLRHSRREWVGFYVSVFLARYAWLPLRAGSDHAPALRPAG
ncbi:hypothetical protein J2W46_006806 [Paraburkholderia strydomiana]|nr:hypothetical protein [Paraburkholderia strydomiana]